MNKIYKIANDINDKIYVGQTTKSIDERIKRHLNDKRGYALHNAIKKYGWEHFSVEVLEDNIPLENLNEREVYWTEKLNALVPNGYVLKAGGQNYQVFSKKTKKKISDAKKGKPTWIKGKHRSPEHNVKLIGPNNGYAKKILCYDLKDNFIKEYGCINDAMRELNLPQSNIVHNCRGNRKRVGNYKFKYKEN